MRVQANGPTTAHAEHGDPSQVIRTSSKKEALPRRIARNTIGILLCLGVLGFAIYTVLALTVLVVVRVDGQNAAVLRSAFPVGQAPSGAYAYVSTAPNDNSLVGKAKQATVGADAGSVVQIVAGPYNRISTDERGYIVSDGQATAYRGDVDDYALDGEYVAICVTGACDPGSAVLIGQHNIIGEVKGFVTLSGITDPTTPSAPARN